MEIELAAGKRYISLNICESEHWTKQPAVSLMDGLCQMTMYTNKYERYCRVGMYYC